VHGATQHALVAGQTELISIRDLRFFNPSVRVPEFTTGDGFLPEHVCEPTIGSFGPYAARAFCRGFRISEIVHLPTLGEITNFLSCEGNWRDHNSLEGSGPHPTNPALLFLLCPKIDRDTSMHCDETLDKRAGLAMFHRCGLYNDDRIRRFRRS
jgi:hypothetical protein